jgi:hypothetical protein
MKKGIIILLSGAVIMLSACKKEIANPETFTFGRICGFCAGDCATVFKLDNNQLFADNMTTRDRSAPHLFQTTPLSDDKRLIAKQLANVFPTQLLNETAETIGCPDCTDQCSYLVIWTQNGVTQKWFIDPFEHSVPDYLKPFVVKIRETLTALQ